VPSVFVQWVRRSPTGVDNSFKQQLRRLRSCL